MIENRILQILVGNRCPPLESFCDEPFCVKIYERLALDCMKLSGCYSNEQLVDKERYLQLWPCEAQNAAYLTLIGTVPQ